MTQNKLNVIHQINDWGEKMKAYKDILSSLNRVVKIFHQIENHSKCFGQNGKKTRLTAALATILQEWVQPHLPPFILTRVRNK